MFERDRLDIENTMALLEVAVLSVVSDGNQVGNNASKLAAVLHFHLIDLQIELPTSPLVISGLTGVARCRKYPKLRTRRYIS